ncbi:hypothetical protein PMAYCL1PPCAC_13656, partial [Pristionchus mayeri]
HISCQSIVVHVRVGSNPREERLWSLISSFRPIVPDAHDVQQEGYSGDYVCCPKVVQCDTKHQMCHSRNDEKKADWWNSSTATCISIDANVCKKSEASGNGNCKPQYYVHEKSQGRFIVNITLYENPLEDI